MYQVEKKGKDSPVLSDAGKVSSPTFSLIMFGKAMIGWQTQYCHAAKASQLRGLPVDSKISQLLTTLVAQSRGGEEGKTVLLFRVIHRDTSISAASAQRDGQYVCTLLYCTVPLKTKESFSFHRLVKCLMVVVFFNVCNVINKST